MNAAAKHSHTKRAALGLACIGLAAVFAGYMGLVRQPDPWVFPDMAPTAITMQGDHTFYAQRHEVTITQWNRCVAEGACRPKLKARPHETASRTPATGLNFLDAQDYVAWVTRRTGHSFRLPTAKEWAAMAAAVLPEAPDPLFTDPSMSWASAYLTKARTSRALRPQGSFSTSPEGVVDLDGSVWEWTQDCYSGSASSADPARCPAYFVGGEHLAAMPLLVRDPAVGGCAVGSPPAHLGLRLVTDSLG